MRFNAIQLHPITNGPDVVLMVPIEHQVRVTPRAIGVADKPPIVVANGDFWAMPGPGATVSALFDRAVIGEVEAPGQ